MLLHLKIRDIAIIEEALIELQPGFTVITGETGAGKSILIDALVLALGGRAGADVVRTGAESAEVEALFDISQHPQVRARLEQRELVGDDPDVLLVRRVIGAKGRAKVLVNGFLSTVATLAEVVKGLVDVSGQHEQLSLLAVDTHLDVLDAFGELDGKRSMYRAAYDRYREVIREQSELSRNAAEADKRADFLRYQLEEIERVAPEPGEDEQLASERQRLVHAEKLKQGAVVAEALLYCEDGSAFDKLGKAAAEVEALRRIDPELAATADGLTSARREIEEAARTLQRYAERIEADPERLATVDERLSALQRLCRKHGGTIAQVIAQRDQLKQELQGLGNSDTRRQELAALAAKLGGELVKLGRDLSAARLAAAKKLDRAIRAEVADMELEDAVFVTQLVARKPAADDLQCEGAAVGPAGLDDVEFLWSANKGEVPRPLAKIASGGELSRLTLGIKRVLAKCDLVSLYVFDEVDTGLGGKAADAIGRKIQMVAKGHQALCITHLAPIAARADHHLRVQKVVQGGRTLSALELVTGGERAQELARMIDGAKITKTTLEAAKAMLSRAG